MNKYQQALNFLYNTIKDNLISFDDTEKEAVEILQELVDKATPTKPSIWGDGYDDKGNIIYDMYDCPNCGKSYEIDYEKYDHCPKCGQRIDWSDEDVD